MTGSLYKRGRIWWMAYVVDGRQRCEGTGETNRRLAQEKLNIRLAQIAQGQFNLLKKNGPRLGEWSEKYLGSVQHENTRRRYASSKANLVSFFGEQTQLPHVSAARITEFKRVRRAEGIKAATLNRDLRFLAQILKQAEEERYIARTPFDLGKFFLNESRERRKPHILSHEEQETLLAVAPPRIRMLTVLGVETGMRTGEMLGLRWTDTDLLGCSLQVGQSKSQAGIRCVPFSKFCQSELIRWRNLIGPEFSELVFPSFSNRRHPLQGGRKAWASVLKKAGIPFFPIYNLRHTFASRMTAAGISSITIAQLLGHSSTQIVPRYAQVLDQNRLDAVRRMEAHRQQTIASGGEQVILHPGGTGNETGQTQKARVD
jgi:integrase